MCFVHSYKTGVSKSAVAPGRVEWYVNNLRRLQHIPVEWDALMPQGTTSSGALHAEIIGWFSATIESISSVDDELFDRTPDRC